MSEPSGISSDSGTGPNVRTVFAGLMLGMFLGAVSQTIIAPAMPRIVADLGAMAHYSWIAVSSLLAATVAVPIVGKLSDIYGRKAFYVGGIIVFMLSSLVAGFAPTFKVFIVARVLEGFGMGTIMPLSQAIIGDLVAPRERGKYQGLMGAVFGLASVVGPFVGGGITDALGWRWLFFANIPLSILALGVIVPFMRLPRLPREHSIDYGGFVTLAVGLTAILLGVTWGGTEYPWSSPVIWGLFAGGAVAMGAFICIECRFPEPVLSPRLWKNDIFTASNLTMMAVAMAMFGAIYYIPIFVQGVLGASVTGAGAVLTPMMLSIVSVSTITGFVVSKTGHYKLPVVIGIAVMGIGFYMLSQMDQTTSYGSVVRNMVFVGLGLGTCLQTFVLIVQNAVAREDLGVATATVQLFRSLGATAGTAILGAIMASQMAKEMGHGKLPQALAPIQADGGEAGAGAILNPALMAGLSPQAIENLRLALSTALQPVFAAALVFVGIAFFTALFIREIPLRRTIGIQPAEAGKNLLAGFNHAGEADGAPVLGEFCAIYRERTVLLGVLYAELAGQAVAERNGELRRLIKQLGRDDLESGLQRLHAAAQALFGECHDEPLFKGGLDDGIRCRFYELDADIALEHAAKQRPSDLTFRLHSFVTKDRWQSNAVLTPTDLDALERISAILSVAFLRDISGSADSQGDQVESHPVACAHREREFESQETDDS